MFYPLALFNLGPWEIALIALLALLLFGGKKLPGLAKDLGHGIKEFRKSLSASSSEEEPVRDETIISEKEKSKKSKKS
ncbi:MAG: twin-arginine translocase TatA/TatE family subunit [Leptospira sp.]|nr:twin-arginine translocase TatA/TatE family subunit [Leptospira sp.]